jgi:hypothetical protein
MTQEETLEFLRAGAEATAQAFKTSKLEVLNLKRDRDKLQARVTGHKAQLKAESARADKAESMVRALEYRLDHLSRADNKDRVVILEAKVRLLTQERDEVLRKVRELESFLNGGNKAESPGFTGLSASFKGDFVRF